MKTKSVGKNIALKLCVTAMFAAVLVAGKEALAFLPNIEVVTIFIALCAYVWGLSVAIPAVLVFIAVDMAIWGINTWVISYLIHWNFLGSCDGGENVCIIRDGDEFLMVHSPANGIAFRRSRDLATWRDCGCTFLGSAGWEWARGRITAGFLLDLRAEPEIGKILLFYHATGPEDETKIFDTHACIGVAWSDDLRRWEYPQEQKASKHHLQFPQIPTSEPITTGRLS